MKERKPYKYQYDGNTLTMRGWCGLNDDEKEWLRQLEYYVDSQRDKFFGYLYEDHISNESVFDRFSIYQSNIRDAKMQIKRLKSRLNARYGDT